MTVEQGDPIHNDLLPKRDVSLDGIVDGSHRLAVKRPPQSVVRVLLRV